MRLRTGWDNDGCTYDFGNSVRRYLASIGREFGWADGKEENHNWNFFEYWGMPVEEFVQVCHDGVDAGYVFAGPLRPNSEEAFERVARLGHEIIIITDRQFGSTPQASHRATELCYQEAGIEYDELWFSADKLCTKTDTFVEDKLENYDELITAGVDAYLINRDWNQVEGGDARNRIDDIIEYAEAIEKITTRGFVDLSFA